MASSLCAALAYAQGDSDMFAPCQCNNAFNDFLALSLLG